MAVLAALTWALLILGGFSVYWFGLHAYSAEELSNRGFRFYVGITLWGMFLSAVVMIGAYVALALLGRGLVWAGLIPKPTDASVGLLAFFALAPVIYFVVFVVAVIRSKHETAA